MIDIDLVIAGASDLRALPQSASRLVGLLSNDDWDLGQITETVKLDPILAGRVFRSANSVARGGRTLAASVDQAVMRLGAGSILAIALGSAARRDLEVAIPSYNLSPGDLWKHSVAASLAIECARGRTRVSAPPETGAAALLHDIGMLVLSKQLLGDVLDFLRRSREEGGHDPVHAELEMLGVHHGEVGGLIAHHWELPPVVGEAIAFHHAPASAPTEKGRLVADFVALADRVAIEAWGKVDEIGPDLQQPEIFQRLGLDAAGYCELVNAVGERLDEVLQRYD